MGVSKNEKVRMNSIKTVSFRKNALTKSRRGEPIAQLKCNGKACELFQPEVVQCTSMGDDGSGEMQWKCDTDLPSSMRLGEVHVSCEGWSRPGDTFVVKGSCGLDYNLIQIDRRLDEGGLYDFSRGHNKLDWPAVLFSIAFFGMAFGIIYSIVRSCLARHAPRYAPRPLSNFWPGGGGGGGGPGGPGGGGPGFNGGAPPPPPYSKDPKADPAPTTDQPASSSSSSNFLTGAALGGAAAYLLSGNNRNRGTESEWDRFRTGQPFGWQGDEGTRRRGESSRMGADGGGLGDMRRATGFGGSSVR